jgi:peroxiredoxin Q/BCP
VAKAFGALGEKKFMGRVFQGIRRNTYVIDPNGQIVKVFEEVDPTKNPQEVLDFLKQAQG